MKDALHYIICSTDETPDSKDINSVYVFPRTGNNEIMMIKNERGWDIPGGHVEKGETLSEALQREAMEEACITIENAVPFVHAKEKDRQTNNKAMLFYHATIQQVFPFEAQYETTQRRLVPKSEVLSLYNGGNASLMRHIFEYLPNQTK